MDMLLALVSGLIGMLVGVFLNRRYEVRKEKLSILKTLIAYRWAPAYQERVTALNIIPVVFSKSVKICDCLELYKKAQNDVTDSLAPQYGPLQYAPPQKLAALDDAYIKLLEEIAKNLGYRNSLPWDKLKSPYIAKCYPDQNGNQIWY